MLTNKACKMVAVMCAIAATFPASAAELTDYSGTWKIEVAGAWQAHPVCFFQQANNRITGTCKGGSNMGTVEGIADKDGLAFTWAGIAYLPGGECLCAFTGKLTSPAKITGTAQNRGVSENFIAIRQN